MHILSLELRGFKSFRDKTVIEFPDDFTVIVGPNGSGKSNLVEAICFALGKSRGLRALSLEDFLHQGDKRVSSAEVTLKLVDEEKRIVIKRRVTKGESQYFVNGRKVTREHVLELVGRNEYNVILQDDVARLLRLSPRERREILDEICGIGEYNKKKERAERDLERVEERISEARVLLEEKKCLLARLEEEKERTLKHKELTSQLRRFEAALLRLEAEKLEAERSRLEGRIKTLSQKALELTAQIEELERRRVEREEQLVKLFEAPSEISIREAEGVETRLLELQREEAEVAAILRRVLQEEEELLRAVRELHFSREFLRELRVLGGLGKLRLLETEAAKRLGELRELISAVEREEELLEAEAVSLNSKLEELRSSLKSFATIAKDLRSEVQRVRKKCVRCSSSLEALKGLRATVSPKFLEELRSLGALGTLRDLTGLPTPGNWIAVKDWDSALSCVKHMKEKKLGIATFFPRESLQRFLDQLKRVRRLATSTKPPALSDDQVLLDLNLCLTGGFLPDGKKLERAIAKLEELLMREGERLVRLDHELRRARENILGAATLLKSEVKRRKRVEEELAKVKEKRARLEARLRDAEEELRRLRELRELVEQLKKLRELGRRLGLLRAERLGASQKLSRLREEIPKLESTLNSLKTRCVEAVEALRLSLEQREKMSRELKELARRSSELRAELRDIESELRELEAEKVKVEERLLITAERLSAYGSVEDVGKVPTKGLRRRLQSLRRELDELGEVNPKALEAWQTLREEVEAVEEKLKRLEEERESLLNFIAEVEGEKWRAFLRVFEELRESFRSVCEKLLEGEGELLLKNVGKRLEEAELHIRVSPRGKRFFSLEAMSTGERALVCSAFLLSLQRIGTPGFCVIDELDASLDKENSTRLARMLKRTRAQFILVTHNDELIREAECVIGVSMSKEGVSRVVGLRPR